MTSNRLVRPLGIIFLIIIAIANAGLNGLRLSEAIFFWKTLEKYGAHPGYIGISGGFWFVSAISLVTGTWLRKTWALIGTIIGIICYSVWYWLDRLFLQLPHSNWLFTLTFTVLLVATCTSIFFSTKTRAYFNILEPRNKQRSIQASGSGEVNDHFQKYS